MAHVENFRERTSRHRIHLRPCQQAILLRETSLDSTQHNLSTWWRPSARLSTRIQPIRQFLSGELYLASLPTCLHGCCAGSDASWVRDKDVAGKRRVPSSVVRFHRVHDSGLSGCGSGHIRRFLSAACRELGADVAVRKDKVIQTRAVWRQCNGCLEDTHTIDNKEFPTTS